jgi:predicted branched-subunit amino acid permease
MRWQDAVLTGCNIVLIAALIPTVLSAKQKPAISTSVITGMVIALMSAVFFTLALWLAATTALVECCLWAIIAGQSWRLRQ